VVKPTGAGELIASPNTVSFGEVSIGQAVSDTVSLQNGGAAQIKITRLSLSGQPFTFVAASELPITLAAGATYHLNLQFNPTAAGAATGQLTIASDSSATGTAVISLSGTGTAPSISIGLTPANVSITAGTTLQFDASVIGTSNTAVAWTVSGNGCSGTACGTISSSGLYAAPASAPSPATITITATSEMEPTESASAEVTIAPRAGNTY
jgi:hypothetical protein